MRIIPDPEMSEEQLERHAQDKAVTSPQWAIAYALLRLASAQRDTAYQLKSLGNGDAATPMGALEAYAKHMGEKVDALSAAVGDIGSGIREVGFALEQLAETLEKDGSD